MRFYLFFVLNLYCIYAQANEGAIAAAAKIAGVYIGEWEVYGPEKAGKSNLLASWTDSLVAKDPILENGKAFVTVTDAMHFKNGIVYNRKFTEGYLVNADGSIGSRYFELNGIIVLESPLGADTWAFETKVDPSELKEMGFDPIFVIFAKHITNKAVTKYKGQETEWITRTTTVLLRENEQVSTIQFLSMKGHHTRIEKLQ